MNIPASTPSNQGVVAQIEAFRRQPLLSESFPLQLPNGAVVPAFNAKCAHCGQTVESAMVHGRVVTSLETVRTVVAQAYCAPCQRLIPVRGRFRTIGDRFQFEFPYTHGMWHVLTKPQNASTLARKLMEWLRRGH